MVFEEGDCCLFCFILIVCPARGVVQELGVSDGSCRAAGGAGVTACGSAWGLKGDVAVTDGGRKFLFFPFQNDNMISA